jgi:hypothetical protein
MKRRGLISVCALILFCAAAAADNWPQFRGTQASGGAEGSSPPISWNAPSGDNIAWSVDVPGLAHSSPVVWGDRIYLTTAVSDETDPELKVGLYGDIQPVEGDGIHRFVVMAFDLKTGGIVWTENRAHRRAESETASEIHPRESNARNRRRTRRRVFRLGRVVLL